MRNRGTHRCEVRRMVSCADTSTVKLRNPKLAPPSLSDTHLALATEEVNQISDDVRDAKTARSFLPR